jgi:hypothetical protein
LRKDGTNKTSEWVVIWFIFGLTIGVDEQFVNAYQVGSWRCEYSHALSNQIVVSSEGILLAALPLYKTDMKSQIGSALPELVAYLPKSGFHW